MSYPRIDIAKSLGEIIVSSPFHPDMPKRARLIGGKWSGGDKAWRFDDRDAQRVRELLLDIYGWTESARTIDVQITARHSVEAYNEGIYAAGRQLARAMDRDSGALLGEGIIHVSGEPPTSGGSRKNWRTVIPQGCTLEIRDAFMPAVIHIDEYYWAVEYPSADADDHHRNERIEAIRREIAELALTPADLFPGGTE